MSVTQCYTADEIDGLLIRYSPLVRAVANRYRGRGAEYEDLVQEGYLVLLQLIPKCSDRKWLGAFLKKRLPGYVRAAAARLRDRGMAVIEEGFENMFPDNRSKEERGAVEIMDLLTRALTKDELDLTQALLEGFTQQELAELRGISQQAVGMRVRKIRDKLSKFI